MASKKNLKYHIVFVTKYRYRILDNEQKQYLQEYFSRFEVQESLKYSLLSCAVESDHVHLVIETKELNIANLVGKLKGRSSFAIHAKFRELLRYNIWGDGYYIATMSSVSQEKIASYIQKQGYKETETIDRTFRFEILPSKRKEKLCEQYLEGVKNNDKTKVPSAMLQRTEGLPEESFKLRSDLLKFQQTQNLLSNYAIRVPGGRSCKTKPFWLALKLPFYLPSSCIVRESYIFKYGNKWVAHIVIREEKIISKFSPKKVLSMDLGIKRPVTSVILQDGQVQKCSFWGKTLKRQIWLREKRRSQIQAASKKYGFEYNSDCTKKYNHRINDLIHKFTKETVNEASKKGYSICIGNLLGIRDKSKHKKGPKKNNVSNYNIHKLPFGKIKTQLEYKAKLVGVPLLFVNEAFTSQQCSKCGHIESSNREKHNFKCKKCSHKTDADLNGAINIAKLASQLSINDCALKRTENPSQKIVSFSRNVSFA